MPRVALMLLLLKTSSRPADRPSRSLGGEALLSVKDAWRSPLPLVCFALQALLFQVQLTLDEAERLIINAALVA